MAFVPITTQEEFDSAISERLRREREKLEKQFADYAELKEKAGKVSDLESQISKLSAQLEKSKSDLETANAKITGLPEQIETLTGRATMSSINNDLRNGGFCRQQKICNPVIAIPNLAAIVTFYKNLIFLRSCRNGQRNRFAAQSIFYANKQFPG